MLPCAQVERYREDGYLLVEGLFGPEELDRLEASFDQLVSRRLAAGAELDATWGGARWRAREQAERTVVLHTHDLQAYCAEWTRALVQERFTAAMSALMGSPNVQLHHTKLFLKPPGIGSPFPLHQDYPHFPHERHSMMAAVLHLTDASEEMGCIRLIPGSHRAGPLPVAEGLHLDPDEFPVTRALPCPARRGDVLFFSYLLVHGSGTNHSGRVRKTVLFQVRDPADRQLSETHRSHAQGLMLRGVHPEVAVAARSFEERMARRAS
jgi:phytanoyl-CoA hydroxylase